MPFDFKKEYKELYMPKNEPSIVSQRIKSEPVYFALRHSSAASSSLGIRQYAAFGFLAAKHRKTK